MTPNRLLFCVVLAAAACDTVNTSSPPDASVDPKAACEVAERSCSCDGQRTGRQVCFEPTGVWSQCACDAPPFDAGTPPVDAGGQGAGARDAGGFPACPVDFACRPTQQGVGLCVNASSMMPPSCMVGADSCEAVLKGSQCREVMSRTICIRLCSLTAASDAGTIQDGGTP